MFFLAVCLGSGLRYCNKGQPRCVPHIFECPPSPPGYQPLQCKCSVSNECACYRGGFPLCTDSGWQCN